MSISSAAKIGTAGTLAASVPTTTYFARDHIFLYEIERDVINGTDKLIVGDPAEGETEANSIKVELKVNDSTKWSCLIKAQLAPGHESTVTLDSSTDKPKLKNYIGERIPSTTTSSNSDSSITDSIKQKNKRKLVWDCSSNRISISDTSIKTELIIQVHKKGNNLMVSLFGTEEEAKNS